MCRRLVLGLTMLLAACDSGGSSNNNVPTVPVLPWGSFRHDPANSAIGGAVGDNGGNPSLLVAFAPDPVTHLVPIPTSTAAVDLNGNIFLGTTQGLFSFNRNGGFRWQFSKCFCPINIPCSYPNGIPIGPIRSSPTVTAGSTIVFGSDPMPESADPDHAGALFAIQDIKQGAPRGSVPGCYWAFRPRDHTQDYRVRSSPIALVNALDLSLQSVFFADSDGVLRGLNPDGTTRWQIQASSEEITSSPALDFSGNIYITTPDGVLTVATVSGIPAWTATVGVPPTTTQPADPDRDLLTSPLIGTNAYVVGEDGSLNARVPNGQERWVYTPANPIVGSPTLILLTFGVQAFTAVDVIVTALDADTNVYAIRDSTGEPMPVQQCSGGTQQNCTTDSCAPTGGTCISNRCTDASGAVGCRADSCLPNNGTCTVIPTFGDQPIASGQTVSTSPVMSADAFIVFGTDDGLVCARAVNGNIPGPAAWNTILDLPGCIDLDPKNDEPVLSSPAIGPNGQIYVTTASGLYTIQ